MEELQLCIYEKFVVSKTLLVDILFLILYLQICVYELSHCLIVFEIKYFFMDY